MKIILGFFFKHYPAYSYKQLCKYYDIPRLKYTDPNHPDVVKWVNNQDIDILIIFSGFIIKQPLIEAVNYYILNKIVQALKNSKCSFLYQQKPPLYCQDFLRTWHKEERQQLPEDKAQ